MFRQLFIIGKNYDSGALTDKSFKLMISRNAGMINSDNTVYYLRPIINEQFLNPFSMKGIWLCNVGKDKFIGLDKKVLVLSLMEWKIYCAEVLNDEIQNYLLRNPRDNLRKMLYYTYVISVIEWEIISYDGTKNTIK